MAVGKSRLWGRDVLTTLSIESIRELYPPYPPRRSDDSFSVRPCNAQGRSLRAAAPGHAGPPNICRCGDGHDDIERGLIYIWDGESDGNACVSVNGVQLPKGNDCKRSDASEPTRYHGWEQYHFRRCW